MYRTVLGKRERARLSGCASFITDKSEQACDIDI
jgi:hypothetical protein